jgi:hypothetical protein
LWCWGKFEGDDGDGDENIVLEKLRKETGKDEVATMVEAGVKLLLGA